MAVLIKFLSTIIMGTPCTTTQAKLNEIKRILICISMHVTHPQILL